MQKEHIFKLHDAIKRYTIDQDKVISPEETVKWALEKISNVPGLRVRLDRDPHPLTGAYIYSVKGPGLTVSGKGITEEQSKASAVMEFSERFSWLNFDYKNSEGYFFGTYNEVVKKGIRTVSEDYFMNNFALDAATKRQFTEEILDIPQAWILGYCLTTREPYYYPLNWHNNEFIANGLAAGNSMEEAIFQGLSEVIEREDIYRFFVERRAGDDVDPETIKNEHIKLILSVGREAGIKYTIKDISSDIGFPTFIVAGNNSSTKIKMLKLTVGQGTHTDPVKALMRAFSEYYESVSAFYRRVGRFAIITNMFADKISSMHTGLLPGCNRDMLFEAGKKIDFGSIPDFGRENIKEEIEHIVRTMDALKTEVVCIDKTHPELKIPVVRVFLPKMRLCMSADFMRPEAVIAQLYHEAGKKDKALEFLKRYYEIYKIDMGGARLKSSDDIFRVDYITSARERIAKGSKSYGPRLIIYALTQLINSCLKPFKRLFAKK